MMKFLLVFCGLCTVLVTSIHYGPRFPPTKGEVWPKPQKEIKQTGFYKFFPMVFEAKITNNSCPILENCLHRFVAEIKHLYVISRRFRINQKKGASSRNNIQFRGQFRGPLKQIQVDLTAPCEDLPHLNMDESYNLTVSTTSILKSNSIWGVVRGIETLAQLFYLSDDYSMVLINGTSIEDYPIYPHRGLLLDTSRHYISLNNILKTLDAMSMNKMNVFHWHIVDDQSFPYQSSLFPELSDQGAYHPLMVYTRDNIETVIEYARQRGIRVLPEFDVPGHTRSWGVAYPDILTKCYDNENNFIGLGPMHPLNKHTYKLIHNLYDEVCSLFPDKYFHIGGDEVDMDCWALNPEIQEYEKENNINSIHQIHTMFILKVLNLLNNNSTPILWQEVFDNGVPLTKDVIVQVWKSPWIQEMVAAYLSVKLINFSRGIWLQCCQYDFPKRDDWFSEKVLNSTQRLLLSAPWYLDNMGATFETLYTASPRQMVKDRVPASQLDHILGGEACMWGEMVDDTNLLTRTWPRASAVAEVLWSTTSDAVPLEALHRIEEHVCRMRRRRLPAEPSVGPGFCIV